MGFIKREFGKIYWKMPWVLRRERARSRGVGERKRKVGKRKREGEGGREGEREETEAWDREMR